MRIREFSGVDFEPLSQILGFTWHSSRGSHAFWYGADELCEHLYHTDHGLVATDEQGTFMGAILLSSPNEADGNPTMKSHWLQQRTRLAAMAAALGINTREEAPILFAEQSLLDQAATQFGSDDVGHIVLVIVSSQARGQGLGRRMLQEGLAWLKEHGAVRVRLVTDDDCDWQMYEHLGMRRLMRGQVSGDAPIGLYVYEANIDELVLKLQ